MPIRRLTDIQLGSIQTTKVLSVTTAETVFTIGSGNRAVEFTNLSTVNVYLGQSGVLVNSGSVITENGSKFYDTVVDDFTIYLVNASAGVTSRVVAQEYAGN